jgi:trehalose/maltose hydrolase-like predicted phosphorylase
VLTPSEALERQEGGGLGYDLIKQADVVLLLHLQPDLFDAVTADATLTHYESRTAHASSLSFAPYGVVAARLGRSARALDYLYRASRYNLDYMPKQGYRNGLHFSAYAGAWQIVAEGILGLRMSSGVLHVTPQLPAPWQRVALSVRFRSSAVRVEATHSKASATLLDGETARVRVSGQEQTLSLTKPSLEVEALSPRIRGVHTHGQ